MMDKVYAVTHSDAEWRRILTPDQYDVMRSHGTEAPDSCALLLEKRAVLVRGVWPTTVRVSAEVRKRHGMAQLQ